MLSHVSLCVNQSAICQDVPQNYLEELSKIWKLQSTEYIDGVPALYTTKGTRFDGVFTKLSAACLVRGAKTVDALNPH